MKSYDVTIQIKATEQYFYMMLFVFQYFYKMKFGFFLNFNYQLCTRGSKNQHYSNLLDLPHTTDLSTVWIGSDDSKHRANEKLTV